MGHTSTLKDPSVEGGDSQQEQRRCVHGARALLHIKNQMKLINVLASAAVVVAFLLSSLAADGYPSVTTICKELRIELEKSMEESQVKQNEVEQMLLRCRDLQ